MITSIKNKDYSFLFKEASDELLRLHNEGKLGDDDLTAEELAYLQENESFTSLEQYFTRLGSLVAHSTNPVKYLMLPLDEPCLEVDANSRTIEVPNNFKKFGASVQGDVIAETLFLRIDRFFDSMDFLETHAFIQWKLPDGTEGASEIIYKDFESEHHLGKLILVWPLTGAITQQEGNVQFSLRFLKKNGNDISYSWNSIPQTITIKKALNSKVDYVQFDDGSDLFKQAITNSTHTSSGDPVTEPSFESPAGNTVTFSPDPTQGPITANLSFNNRLTLEGQAWVEGQGRLTYDWKYSGSNNGPVVSGANVQGALAKAFRVVSESSPIENKVYYIKNTSTTPVSYESIPSDQFNTFKEEGVEIFERYALYQINEDTYPVEGHDSVTGLYELSAIHKLGFDSSRTTLQVVIPGPDTLEFVSGDDKVDNEKTIKTGLPLNGTFITADNKLNLNVEVDNGDPAADAWQSMSYTWKMKTTPDGELTVLDGMPKVYANLDTSNTDSISLDNAAPGWYQVTATSMLNRDTISIDSDFARVTKDPVAPTLPFYYDPDHDNVDIIDATSGPVTIEVEHESYSLPIELHSDKLIYNWVSDGGPITNETEGFVIEDNKITIDPSKFEETRIALTCEVSNELNGKVSSPSKTGLYIVELK